MGDVELDGDIWTRSGRTVAAGGRAVGRAFVWVGKGISSAYVAIDPDVRRHVAQLPADRLRPIVFVHGLGGPPGNFLPMRKFFSLNGRKRTYAVGLDSSATMQSSADELSRFIDDVVRVNDLPEDATVDCVAHSMG